jgi:hypothetical protein
VEEGLKGLKRLGHLQGFIVLVHLAEDALGHLRGLHQGDHVILCHKAPASTEGAFALSRCARTIIADKFDPTVVALSAVERQRIIQMLARHHLSSFIGSD